MEYSQVFSPYFKRQKVFVYKIYADTANQQYTKKERKQLSASLQAAYNKLSKTISYEKNPLECFNTAFKKNYLECFIACITIAEKVSPVHISALENVAFSSGFSSLFATKLVKNIFNKTEHECIELIIEKLTALSNDLDNYAQRGIISDNKKVLCKSFILEQIIYLFRCHHILEISAVFSWNRFNILSKKNKLKKTFYKYLLISKYKYTAAKRIVYKNIDYAKKQMIDASKFIHWNGVAIKGVSKMGEYGFNISVKFGEGCELSYACKDDSRFESPIQLPKLASTDKVFFYSTTDEGDERKMQRTYEELQAILGDEDRTGAARNINDSELKLINILERSSLISPDELRKLPTLNFEDITETELFGFQPISATDLADKEKGLWAFHGRRKVVFKVENMLSPFFENDPSALTVCADLSFSKYDNEELERKIKCQVRSNSDVTAETYILTGWIDTDEFGKYFKDNNHHRYTFYGNLTLVLNDKTKKQLERRIVFPLNIAVQNTQYYPNEKSSCVPLSNKYVSIDFGTSSTCIAIKRGDKTEMIALSPDNANDGTYKINRFENPTNIMVFRWENLYKEWANSANFPHFIIGSKYDDFQKTKEPDYDLGYSVKSALQDADRKTLDSILTEIKMLPYYIDKGLQITLNPYIDDKIKVVYIVDECEKQDTTHFDPIAFYGYLIGRVINNPSSGTIYHRYAITYPVKFNNRVVKKMKASLDAGIRASLPTPIRTAKDKNGKPLFTLVTKHSEPVSYVGAIAGTYLPCDMQPQCFAIYDFGGGTLDFSFGLLRTDEESDSGIAIDVYGSGGRENYGGEFLISLLSFWILTDNEQNKQTIIENEIPFVIPDGQDKPADFPEHLLSNTSNQTAKANIRKINETFSRMILEASDACSGIDEETVYLFNKNGSQETIVVHVDYDVLKEKLTRELEGTIIDFRNEMEKAFTSKFDELQKHNIADFHLSQVHIFRSGNTSKSSIIDGKLKEYFPENEIALIDETENDKDYRYAITPKTAVALGQLELITSGTPVNNIGSKFRWYIVRENKANGTYNIIIDKNKKAEWTKYARVRNDEFTVFFSENPPTDNTSCRYNVTTVQVNGDYEGYDVYLKPVSETEIEYWLCNKDSSPQDAEISDDQKGVITLEANNE